MNRTSCNSCGLMVLEEIIQANDGICLSCQRKKETEKLQIIIKKNQGQEVIFSTPALMLANRSISYRTDIHHISNALAELLTEKKLTHINLSNRFQQNPAHFYFSQSDLNQEGQNFISNALDKWLGNIDRWQEHTPHTLDNYKISIQKAYNKWKKPQQKNAPDHAKRGG